MSAPRKFLSSMYNSLPSVRGLFGRSESKQTPKTTSHMARLAVLFTLLQNTMAAKKTLGEGEQVTPGPDKCYIKEDWMGGAEVLVEYDSFYLPNFCNNLLAHCRDLSKSSFKGILYNALFTDHCDVDPNKEALVSIEFGSKLSQYFSDCLDYVMDDMCHAKPVELDTRSQIIVGCILGGILLVGGACVIASAVNSCRRSTSTMDSSYRDPFLGSSVPSVALVVAPSHRHHHDHHHSHSHHDSSGDHHRHAVMGVRI